MEEGCLEMFDVRIAHIIPILTLPEHTELEEEPSTCRVAKVRPINLWTKQYARRGLRCSSVSAAHIGSELKL